MSTTDIIRRQVTETIEAEIKSENGTLPDLNLNLNQIQGVSRTPDSDSKGSDFLKANAAVVLWLIFLGFGGTLLTLYYAQIGYLPDIEWRSSLVYLGAASVIGGGVGVLFALSVFVPGFIWEEFLVVDNKLSGILCLSGDPNDPCIKSIFLNVGLLFGIAVLVSHVVLVIVFQGLNRSTETAVAWSALIELIVLLAASVVMWWRSCKLLGVPLPQWLKTNDNSSKGSAGNGSLTEQQKEDRRKRTFKYTFWFALSVFVSQISMLVVYLLSDKPSGWRFAGTTAICFTGVMISNHVVALCYRHSKRQAIIASLVVAFLVLVAADQIVPFSYKVMGHFGFGVGRKYDLVVDSHGVEVIAKLDLSHSCNPQNFYKLCNVEILSRLGTEYYLSIKPEEARSPITFTFPKADVLSFDSPDPRPLDER